MSEGKRARAKRSKEEARRRKEQERRRNVKEMSREKERAFIMRVEETDIIGYIMAEAIASGYDPMSIEYAYVGEFGDYWEIAYDVREINGGGRARKIKFLNKQEE